MFFETNAHVFSARRRLPFFKMFQYPFNSAKKRRRPTQFVMPIAVRLNAIKNESGAPLVIDLTENLDSDEVDNKALLTPVGNSSDNFLDAILGNGSDGPLQTPAFIEETRK